MGKGIAPTGVEAFMSFALVDTDVLIDLADNSIQAIETITLVSANWIG